MSDHNFFAELKRRNVYKVAVAYAVVSWLLIQIAAQVFPFFDSRVLTLFGDKMALSPHYNIS